MYGQDILCEISKGLTLTIGAHVHVPTGPNLVMDTNFIMPI